MQLLAEITHGGVGTGLLSNSSYHPDTLELIRPKNSKCMIFIFNGLNSIRVVKLRFTFFCVRMTASNKDLMVRLITLLLLCVTLFGCEKELPVYSDNPLDGGGLLYKPNSNEPITAKVESYHENGQLEMLYTAIDGKPEGLKQSWHDNGQLELRGTYVNGKREGLAWFSSGTRTDSLSIRARMSTASSKA